VAKISESFERLNVFNNIKFFELKLMTIESKDMKVIETLNLAKLYVKNFRTFLSHESLEILSNMGRLSKLMVNLFNSGNISDSKICHLIKNSIQINKNWSYKYTNVEQR